MKRLLEWLKIKTCWHPWDRQTEDKARLSLLAGVCFDCARCGKSWFWGPAI